MVKRELIFVALILISMQFILATDTEITIKTLPNYKVSVSMLKTDVVYYLLDSAHVNSDSNGTMKTVLSTDEDNFNLIVSVGKDGVKVVSKKFDEGFATGTPVTLELYPAWYVPPTSTSDVKNNSANATLSAQNTTKNAFNLSSDVLATNKSKSVTGLSISWDKDAFPRKYFYSILGIIILLIVFFILWKIIKKKKFGVEESTEKEFKTKKMSELVKERDSMLRETQRKLREAQEELNKMKNQEKIKEIERRIDEDKKELSKLKGGRF